jgi:hypothetical protein
MRDDRDNVTPIRRKAPALPPGQAALHRRVQRAQPGARALAAEQARREQAGYMAALSRQVTGRLLQGGRVVPARITIALDLCGLDGPGVDAACGAAEPDVDLWELGLAVPTADQVVKLAALTGFGPAYFYRPIPAGPLVEGITMCGRGGCETVEPDVVDERGVLHYGGQTRRPPQGALF